MILSTAWAIDWPFHFASVFAGPWVIAPASDKTYLCLPRSCRLRLNNVIQIIKKVPSIRMLGMSRYWGQNSCIEKTERTCDLPGFSSQLRSSHFYESFVLEALRPPFHLVSSSSHYSLTPRRINHPMTLQHDEGLVCQLQVWAWLGVSWGVVVA